MGSLAKKTRKRGFNRFVMSNESILIDLYALKPPNETHKHTIRHMALTCDDRPVGIVEKY